MQYVRLMCSVLYTQLTVLRLLRVGRAVSGPRSVQGRALQGEYSARPAAFSRWVHVVLALRDRAT